MNPQQVRSSKQATPLTRYPADFFDESEAKPSGSRPPLQPMGSPGQATESPASEETRAEDVPVVATAWFASSKGMHEGKPRQIRRGLLMLGMAALVVVALAAGAILFLGGKASAQPLAFSFTKGQRSSYRFALSMHGGLRFRGHVEPIDAEFSSDAGWRVLSVDRHGVATIQLTMSNVHGSMAGQPLGRSPATKEKIRIGSDGRMLTLDGVPLGPQLGAIDATSGAPFMPVLPDHPVKPGDTWTSAFDSKNTFGKGQVHYETHSVLLRYEDLGGIHAAVVRTAFAVPIHLTIDLRKLLAATVPGSKADLFSGGRAIVSIDGSYRFGMTAWVAPETGELLREMTEGPVKLTTKMSGIKGFPRGVAMEMTLFMKLAVTRLDLAGSSRTS